MPIHPRVLIAGLGNLLLKDDGVGIHAVRALQRNPPPGALPVEIGTAVLEALHLLEAADLVLAIDAMEAGGPSGTVYLCPIDDVAADRPASLHELGLVSALHFLPLASRPRVIVLGVEPAVIDYGMELSQALEEALPEVVRAAREIAAGWRSNGQDPLRSPPGGKRGGSPRLQRSGSVPP